jgi:hypothetical protein
MHPVFVISVQPVMSRFAAKPESEIVHTPVEALVPAEVWDKAYAILMDGKRARRRPGKQSAELFTGVALCECGRRMYLRHGTPNYICNSVGGCGNRVRRTTLESMEFRVTVTKQNDIDVELQYFPYSEKLSNYPRTFPRSGRRAILSWHVTTKSISPSARRLGAPRLLAAWATLASPGRRAGAREFPPPIARSPTWRPHPPCLARDSPPPTTR